ncbi:MAG TPA: hypothetical protein VN622_09075 [Clostridia bacterium]|nr:hypothetical protein [Clostridia bacterium]
MRRVETGTIMVGRTRWYYAMIDVPEIPPLDHACGPDCACWNEPRKAKTARPKKTTNRNRSGPTARPLDREGV